MRITLKHKGWNHLKVLQRATKERVFGRRLNNLQMQELQQKLREMLLREGKHLLLFQ